ncbi:hypothetical protein KZO01_07290 [Kurthia zopfii]|uniref:Tetratricopeptide repeat protein n=1 Tax=Kurthia zopfii TaxID=1650 RepID=A0A8B4QAN0_9BACL|nr:hypothetical protein [Kurthia zopfii]PWI22964.1 hypothetical protein DF281_04785 [Kurthia zopfii]TDR40934.1 hypothetical protein DFR61_10749 [Kurthia zopfii]GEK30420.1 hypothetical protein KZO01_07290 [Kurthia zopfii]STX09766.1 Uncharacterised protein [Kurthia zopfii]
MINVNKLVQDGISLRNQGSYSKARLKFTEAIQVEPFNSNYYRQYGQLSYLLGEHRYAFAAYLSALHIEVAKVEHYGLTEESKPLYDRLPSKIKKSLPVKGALMLYYDTNTLRHLAHAIADFDEEMMSKEPQLLAFKQLYEADLKGDYKSLQSLMGVFNRSLDDIREEEAEFYIYIGRELALEWIKWKQIDNLDVGQLYFP